MMDDVHAFANSIKTCFLATTSQDGQPRVRGMLMWYSDPTGFYFHTSASKEVGRQLLANPEVEACFYKDGDGGAMLRVRGLAEQVRDEALAQKLLTERAWLGDIMKAHEEENLLIFRIVSGEAHFWRMGDNLKEAAIPRHRF